MKFTGMRRKRHVEQKPDVQRSHQHPAHRVAPLLGKQGYLGGAIDGHDEDHDPFHLLGIHRGRNQTAADRGADFDGQVDQLAAVGLRIQVDAMSPLALERGNLVLHGVVNLAPARREEAAVRSGFPEGEGFAPACLAFPLEFAATISFDFWRPGKGAQPEALAHRPEQFFEFLFVDFAQGVKHPLHQRESVYLFFERMDDRFRLLLCLAQEDQPQTFVVADRYFPSDPRGRQQAEQAGNVRNCRPQRMARKGLSKKSHQVSQMKTR